MRAHAGAQPIQTEFGRYFLASLAALALDVAVLSIAAERVHYLLAASLGFSAGACALYLLATRWVFCRRKLAGKAPLEFSAFLAIGLCGLALNDLVIYLAVEHLAYGLLVAKSIAAGASFVFNYTARKLALF